MKNKRLMIILAVVGLLLLVPLVAMQFTNEVNWSGFDFLVMGVLLLGTGLICELVLRKVKKRTSRLVLCLAVLGVFILVWMELAVGIFGTPFAGS
jgi:hypothetical protein